MARFGSVVGAGRAKPRKPRPATPRSQRARARPDGSPDSAVGGLPVNEPSAPKRRKSDHSLVVALVGVLILITSLLTSGIIRWSEAPPDDTNAVPWGLLLGLA